MHFGFVARPIERRYAEKCGVMNVFFVIGGQVLTPESRLRRLAEARNQIARPRVSGRNVMESQRRAMCRSMIPVQSLRARLQQSPHTAFRRFDTSSVWRAPERVAVPSRVPYPFLYRKRGCMDRARFKQRTLARRRSRWGHRD